MKLQAAFLADAALMNSDGTFMVWRGGITEIASADWPAQVQFALVLRLEADPDEARELHEMSLHIVHAETEVVPWQATPLALRVAPGEPRLYLNIVVSISFDVELPGEGLIEAIIDGDMRVPHLHYAVRAAPGSHPR
jgi:hypothetical protein